MTDGQTDRQTGVFQYFLSRAFGAAGDNKTPRDARAHRRRHGRLSTNTSEICIWGKTLEIPIGVGGVGPTAGLPTPTS